MCSQSRRELCTYEFCKFDLVIIVKLPYIIVIYIYITFSHLADTFIQSDLQLGVHKAINFDYYLKVLRTAYESPGGINYNGSDFS